MIHGPLTLLMRSVRADAQMRRAHALRIGAVGFMLLLLLLAHARGSLLGAPGLHFFQFISVLGAILITLAGIGHFSSAITEEKEEGTLGLLLMANISPLGILLGKSTNRILSVGLVFLAQFPFALLSLTLGGLTVGQIAAVWIALGAHLFFMANLALFCSVLARRTTQASIAVAAVILLLALGPPALSGAVGKLVGFRRLSEASPLVGLSARLMDFHEEASLVRRLDEIFDIDVDARLFSLQAALSVVAGAALFLLAWLRFQRIVWAVESAPPRRSWSLLPRSRRRVSMGRVWPWAFVWKDFHFVVGGWGVLLSKTAFYACWAGLCLWQQERLQIASGMNVYVLLYWSFWVFLALEIMHASSQTLHVEVKGGTLPTLLTLPETSARFGYGKAAGCLLASLPTVAGLVVSDYFAGGVLRTSERLLSLTSLGVICGLLLLGQLTMLCSLYVRWGSLPLAAAILVIGGSVLLPSVIGALQLMAQVTQGNQSDFAPVVYLTVILSIGFQLAMGRQLRILAGR